MAESPRLVGIPDMQNRGRLEMKPITEVRVDEQFVDAGRRCKGIVTRINGNRLRFNDTVRVDTQWCIVASEEKGIHHAHVLKPNSPFGGEPTDEVIKIMPARAVELLIVQDLGKAT